MLRLILSFLVIFLLLAVFKFSKTASYFLIVSMSFLIVVSTVRFIKNLREKIRNKKDAFNPDYISLTTEKDFLVVKEPSRGILVAGGAGSGKSESILVPFIGEGIKKDFSMVVYDFKFPTLADTLVSFTKQYGKKCKISYVTFDYPEKSNRINPISHKYIKSSNDVRAIVKALMYKGANRDTDFWQATSENILTAGILYFMRHHSEICTIPHVFSFLLHPDKKTIINKISEDAECKMILSSAASLVDNEKTLGDVFATMQNYLSIFVNENVYWVLSGDEVNPLVNDPTDPGILIFGNSPAQSKVNGPLISLLMTLTINKMNERGRQKSLIILDEAPTIYIPDFDQIPATARSNRVATIYGVQDISQIESMYGREKTESILSNLATQFFGRTLNTKTSERISKLFGKREVETESKTFSPDGLFTNRVSRTISTRVENVYESDVLSNLLIGEFITLLSSGSKGMYRYKTSNPFVTERVPEKEMSTEDLKANFHKIMNETNNLFN